MTPRLEGTTDALILFLALLVAFGAYTWALWRVVGTLTSMVNGLIAEVAHLRERIR